MANSRKTRFTIYDVMEQQGVFEDNPANTVSGSYKGPVQYPKMFYHPLGEERVIQRAEIIATPMGPEKVGELKQLVTRVAANPEEEAILRELGWHDHPAKAIQAGGREPPAVVAPNRESELESEIRRLTRELEAARNSPKQDLPLKDAFELRLEEEAATQDSAA